MKTELRPRNRILLRLLFAIFASAVFFTSVSAGSSKLFVFEQAELFGETLRAAEQQTLSEECQSELFQSLQEISIHTENPLLIEHADLISRCNAELNAIYDAERATSRAVAARTIAPLQGLINFENPHVHPIDITPNGNTLLAVNTAAHMLEVYAISGTNLVHQQQIPVGLDPVSVRARSNTEVWVVNHVSDSVSIVNLTSGTVTRTLFTDNEPADVVFAGSPLRAFVTASEANAINVFNLGNLNAAPQRVDILGEDPRALAVSNNGQFVYAAIFESGNNTRVAGSGSNASIVRGTTLADNDVAVLNANTLALSFQSGIMNANMALAVHPTNNQISVVGTEALNDIVLEPNLNGIFLRVNMARFSQGGTTTINDLNPHLDYSTSSVAQSQRNLSVGDPRGIAWRDNGSQAFITGMGSNNVIVVNGSGSRVDNIEVGEGPTGIVLKDSANLGYVMNKFAGSISVIDLTNRSEIRQVTFDDPTPSVIKAGRPFLYDTHRTSGLGHTSCASCHLDARTDRLAWDLGDPNAAAVSVPQASNSTGALTGNNVSVPGLKGPMVTQTLQDIMEHPRLHWRGDREDLAAFNPAFEGLLGDTSQLTSAEMQQFGDFLATIWLQPNPYRNIDDTCPNSVTLPDGRIVNSPTLDALRGNNQFNNNCMRCHKGGGAATRNFGVNAEIGSQIIAPSFVGLYDKMGLAFGTSGFGFFHTGEADVDRASRLSTVEQNDDFLAELLTVGGPSGPFVGDELRQVPHAGMGQQLTLNGSTTSAQLNLLNQFESIAGGQFAALIAHARINGVQRGFIYTGSDNFQSDKQAEQMTEAQLRAIAAGGEPVTFTIVAAGMETRLALDSDLDGVFNGDENQQVSCDTRGLLFERWDGIPGTAITDLTGNASYPLNPDVQQTINTFEIASNVSDEYGVRLRGYIEPTVSGSYTFWIASDDNGELWMSDNANAAAATRIANVPGWTNSREWDKYPAQQSAARNLVAGERYYVEVLMKEWLGGDNLSVAWQRAGSSRALIGNANLCTYELIGEAPIASINATPTVGDAPLSVSFNGSASSDPDGSIVSYQWDFGNGGTASGATATAIYSLPGVYSARLTVTDNDGRVTSTTRDITVNSGGSASCNAPGLQYQRWENISGLSVSDLTSNVAYPDSPSVTDTITDFEIEQNILQNYGVRVRGFIEAPVSGSYTFWIASDDNGELWLSSDDNPENASLIASVPTWAAPRQWDWYPEQRSAEISLSAGDRYYVEALMKEFGGGDNLAVAWQAPGGVRQVIPSVVLCQLEPDNNARPVAAISANPTTGQAPLAVSFNGSGSTDDGTIVSYAWDFGDGTSATGANRSHSYTDPGVYLATLTVTDDGGKTDTETVTIAVTTPGGGVNCDTQGVTREVWNNIWNGSVAAMTSDSRYPNSPTSSSVLNSFIAPSNVGDGYGARMRGYITAPETGAYTFWVASDNEGQLLLSTDTNPANASQIAQTFWSPEQGWDYSSSQQSVSINLVAGDQYYIEGLHYASWGGDYYAVAWDTPSGSRQVIPQSALCAFDTGGGRATGDRATTTSLLMQSSVAQTFPPALYDDLLLVLVGNQPLRESLLALRDETVVMLQGDAVISAEYLQSLNALYTELYDSASPELQAWLDSVWTRSNVDQYQGDRSVNAWVGVNASAVPTSVQLSEAPASGYSTLLVTTGMLLLLLVITTKLRSRRD